MREQFKRAAKVSLSISKSDANALRDTLTRAIKPMVEYLASELVAIATRRFQAEVEQMGEAFEVAISAYASATEPAERIEGRAPAGSRKAGSVKMTSPDGATVRAPDVRGGVTQTSTQVAVSEPAVAAEQGSTFFVGGAVSPPGLVDLDESPNFAPGRARGFRKVARKGQTSDIPAREEAAESKSAVDPSPVPEADYSSRGAPRASGNGGFSAPSERSKYAGACSKCKLPGHNARTCRRARGEHSEADAAPPAVPATAAERRAVIEQRVRNANRPVAHRDDDIDDNPSVDERWPKSEIDEETAATEARKLTGALPDLSSSWSF